MTNIIFVSHEDERIPSGVITILEELFEIWPNKYQITFFSNQNHWALEHFKKKFKDKNLNFIHIDEKYLNNSFFKFKNYPKFLRKIFKILSMPLFYLHSLRSILYLYKVLKTNKVHTIFSHNGGWPGGTLNRLIIYAGFLAKIKKRVLVIHSSGKLTNIFDIIKFKIIRILIVFMATDILTVSHSTRNLLLSEEGFPKKKINVIYNGINTNKLPNNKSLEKINFSINSNIITIGFVGEIRHHKGLHILFESLKFVHEKIELIIIGNGDAIYIKMLKKLATTLNHEIKFLGYRSDAKELYRYFDILVLPSIANESFGIVLLEAMKFNLPVICSDFGGMKEVVVNNESGFIYKSFDFYELSSKLNTLIKNKSLRIEFGNNGQKRLINYFSSQIMLKKYLNLIEND